MILTSVLRAILSFAGRQEPAAVPPVRKGRCAASRQKGRPKLELELLEDRCLLAAWLPIGPSPQHNPASFKYFANEDVTGRVSALALTSNYDGAGDPALLLGAAGGGVWRSTNFTAAAPTWTPRTDGVGLPTNVASGFGDGAIDIGAIAVDPNNSRIIYAGTGEANPGAGSRYGTGVLKSTDGGGTWAVISQGPGDAFFRRSISSLFVDPNNSSNVYAAVVDVGRNSLNNAQDGIYKSTDAGATWKILTGADPGHIGANAFVTALDYTMDAPGKFSIYAGVETGVTTPGIFRSQDDGATWQEVDSIPGGGRIALAADHRPGAGLVYAAVSTGGVIDPAAQTLLNIYQSTNSGDAWTTVPKPSAFGNQTEYNLALGLSPTGRLYLAGAGYPTDAPPTYAIYESNVGATIWRTIDVGTNGVIPHSDSHAFAFAPDGTVYLGNDGGVWRYHPLPTDPSTPYAVGTAPQSGAAGDFNGDGKTDLVVSSPTDHNLSVLLGNGPGSFNAAKVVGLPLPGGKTASPGAVIVADLNGDGKLDLVVADDVNGQVLVLLGNGDGTFQAPLAAAVDGAGAHGLAVGDFNGDGKLDLAVTDAADNRVDVLLGNGDGTFKAAVSYATGSAPGGVVVGDFDADGHPDIAVADFGSNQVSVLLGKGDGTFKAHVDYATGKNPIAIAAAAVNNDGILALLVANNSDDTVSVLPGKSLSG